MTVYVAPMPVVTYLAARWPLVAAMFAIVAVWAATSHTRREIVALSLLLALMIVAANADACMTRTTIRLSRARLSRLAASPFGTVDEAWAVRSVRDVVVTARPPTVELRLAGGETAILASPATADEAEAIAAALRRALRTYTRERDAATAV